LPLVRFLSECLLALLDPLFSLPSVWPLHYLLCSCFTSFSSSSICFSLWFIPSAYVEHGLQHQYTLLVSLFCLSKKSNTSLEMSAHCLWIHSPQTVVHCTEASFFVNFFVLLPHPAFHRGLLAAGGSFAAGGSLPQVALLLQVATCSLLLFLFSSVCPYTASRRWLRAACGSALVAPGNIIISDPTYLVTKTKRN
jgi:hypothetical protein